MSKQRARTREARAAEATRRAEEQLASREKAAAERARRERRALTWRRLRLWQHGRSFRRNHDGWAALGTLVLVLVLLAYLFTDSWSAVLLVLLVLAVSFPALVMLTFDRRRK